jgi:hypothetical protein
MPILIPEVQFIVVMFYMHIIEEGSSYKFFVHFKTTTATQQSSNSPSDHKTPRNHITEIVFNCMGNKENIAAVLTQRLTIKHQRT